MEGAFPRRFLALSFQDRPFTVFKCRVLSSSPHSCLTLPPPPPPKNLIRNSSRLVM